MAKLPKKKRIQAGEYRVGEYKILEEKRHHDSSGGWRVYNEVTSNSIEHRKAAETELEALRTLKEAVEYVARQIEFEERQPSAGAD
jgi:hypothetical protein